jgi:hypothetical protein
MRLRYKRRTWPEHMFNILNNHSRKGKNPPMVCKILDWVSSFPHGIPRSCGRLFYVLEGMGFRNCRFPLFGSRIAFVIWQPVLLRIPSGKD